MYGGYSSGYGHGYSGGYGYAPGAAYITPGYSPGIILGAGYSGRHDYH